MARNGLNGARLERDRWGQREPPAGADGADGHHEALIICESDKVVLVVTVLLGTEIDSVGNGEAGGDLEGLVAAAGLGDGEEAALGALEPNVLSRRRLILKTELGFVFAVFLKVAEDDLGGRDNEGHVLLLENISGVGPVVVIVATIGIRVVPNIEHRGGGGEGVVGVGSGAVAGGDVRLCVVLVELARHFLFF